MKKGFTIIDGLIVLAIVASLVAISLCRNQKQIGSSTLVENPTERLTNERYQVLGLQTIRFPGFISDAYILHIKDTQSSFTDETFFIFNKEWCTQIK